MEAFQSEKDREKKGGMQEEVMKVEMEQKRKIERCKDTYGAAKLIS